MDRILLKDDPKFDKIFNLLVDRLDRAVMIEMVRSKIHHIRLSDESASLCFEPEEDEQPNG